MVSSQPDTIPPGEPPTPAPASRMVEAIESGATSEVVIARKGRPVARRQFTAPPSIDASNSLIAEDPRLGSHSRTLMTNKANGVLLSWAEQSAFELLPIDLPHLLTADAAFGAYGCLLQDARR